MKPLNKVQLITYPDSLGGNLESLDIVLNRYFKDIFRGGVHILPPFPSSGDRGFSPLTYLEIEPAFGGWEDIKKIGENFPVMLDLMVNHISRKSEYFKDYLAKGDESEYSGMFITPEKVWPEGIPSDDEIQKIFLRREKPFSTYGQGDSGEEITVWTTFGKTDPSEQTDVDINSPVTKKMFSSILKNFHKYNVGTVRLDAVGYVIKKRDTSCFFVEPEIFDFMKEISELAQGEEITLLPELHSHFSRQYKMAEKGYWIYDFILPYLILETLFTKKSGALKKYLNERPEKQFTMLDCHDGIPVKPDLDDIADSEAARNVVDICLERGANLSRIKSSKHKSPDGFDVHQIRGTIYSLLGEDDDTYIAARALQFFTPGIPQVYYVGLLAGANDINNENAKTDGREINRHNFSIDEVEQAIKKTVVKRLLELIRFRNDYPAFNGNFSVPDSDEGSVILKWENSELFCRLIIDLASMNSSIEYVDSDGELKLWQI